MKVRSRIALTFIDVALLLTAFTLAVILKPSSGFQYFMSYAGELVMFTLLWLIVSTIGQKLDAEKYTNLKNLNRQIIITNLFILATCTLAMYTFRNFGYSRFIVFGTIIITTVLELILAYFYYYLKHAKTARNGTAFRDTPFTITPEPAPPAKKEPLTFDYGSVAVKKKVDRTLVAEAGKEVYGFIDNLMDLSNGHHIFFSTNNQTQIETIPEAHYDNIINLKRINDIRYINKFFESVNAKIPENGMFVGCAETDQQRKQRIMKKFPPLLNVIYYMMDFVLKRIFPKFSLTKKIYFFLTRGNNRVISKAETLGRLYSCGFEIADQCNINGKYYFAARKIKQPAFDENPTYGPFIKLPRIGMHGKKILVYKFRTMHPFAEYIQDYIYATNSLRNGGKFQADFRITTLGKLFRKCWLDELPMLINFFKGEMKLVGVRPLSEHYFNLYSKELQEKRIRYKPGLIPPFYADMPETLDEIQNSELRYLEAYEKNPLLTDWTYFWKAFFNIVLRRKRSG